MKVAGSVGQQGKAGCEVDHRSMLVVNKKLAGCEMGMPDAIGGRERIFKLQRRTRHG
jgi:hypothetical protein